MLSEEKRFYVYVYLDPRKPGKVSYGSFLFDYRPMYVGKGQNNRDIAHIKFIKKLSKQSKNAHFYNSLHKILKLGLRQKVIRLYENLTEKQAFEKEDEVIVSIGRLCDNSGPLLNKSVGIKYWSGHHGRINKWKIFHPNGQIEFIKSDLKSWCKKHNFNYSSVKTFSKRKRFYKGFAFNVKSEHFAGAQ
jgi:hypothetical protein